MGDVPSVVIPLLRTRPERQPAFGYSRERWLGWLGHLTQVNDVLVSLPEALDRDCAARKVEQLIPGNVPAAFVVAMIWGHGKTGYGPYRTARVLTGLKAPAGAPLSQSVVDRLTESIEVSRRESAVAGFRFLNNDPGRIAFLGPAFFTKWLYFATARGVADSAESAPILDALVTKWLADKAGITIRRGRTDDYRTYLQLLADWGSRYGLTSSAVEARIFEQIRKEQEAIP